MVDIFSWTQSGSCQVREGALTIFTELVTDHAELFQSQCAALVQIITAGLNDPESLDIRVLAVQSIPVLIKAAAQRSSQLRLFKELAGPVVDVCVFSFFTISLHC